MAQTERKYGYSFYCRTANGVSGAEITLAEKDGKTGKAGRVGLRFFATGKKAFFSMESHEAHRLARLLMKATQDIEAGKGSKYKMAPHKHTKGEETSTTSVTVEAWARNGKSGVSLLCAKGNDMFNIGIGDDAAFMADMLKEMAVKAAWIEGNYVAESPREMLPLPDDEPYQSPQKENLAKIDARLIEVEELIKKSNADITGFLGYFKAPSLDKFPTENLDKAIAMLRAKLAKTVSKDPELIEIEALMLKTLTDTSAFLTYFKAPSLDKLGADNYGKALTLLRKKAALG